MIRVALVLCLLATPAAAGWRAAVDACVAYVETGRLAVFGGWTADCGALPCPANRVRLRGPEGAAVVLSVGAGDPVGARLTGAVPAVLGDTPSHADCRLDDGGAPATAAIAGGHALWVHRARAEGRLMPVTLFAGDAAGPYVGCAYDGRLYQVEFSLKETGPALFRVYLPAREAAPRDPDCSRSAS
ncbi:hypothetical protein DXV76_13575 [Rhodobacteraceae bacterium CCMM004]|nr:hypothetical protein DXV76_13575 [Rhodobacteraceae bacterium CCMM004]